MPRNPFLPKEMKLLTKFKQEKTLQEEEMLVMGSNDVPFTQFEELFAHVGIHLPQDEALMESRLSEIVPKYVLPEDGVYASSQVFEMMVYVLTGERIILAKGKDERTDVGPHSPKVAIAASVAEVTLSLFLKGLMLIMGLTAAWHYVNSASSEDPAPYSDSASFVALFSQALFLCDSSFEVSAYPIKFFFHLKEVLKNSTKVEALKWVASLSLGIAAIVPLLALQGSTFMRVSMMISLFSVATSYSLKSWKVVSDSLRPTFLPVYVKEKIYKSCLLPGWMKDLLFSLPEETSENMIRITIRKAIKLEHQFDEFLSENHVDFFDHAMGFKRDLANFLLLCGYSLDTKKIEPRPLAEAMKIDSNRSIKEFVKIIDISYLLLIFTLDREPHTLFDRIFERPIIKFFSSLFFWLAKNLAVLLFITVPFAVSFLYSLKYYSNNGENDNFYEIIPLTLLSAIPQTLPYLVASIQFLSLAKREAVELIHDTGYLLFSWLFDYQPDFGRVSWKSAVPKLVSTLVLGVIFAGTYRLIGTLPSRIFEDHAMQAQEEWQDLLDSHEPAITQFGADHPVVEFIINWISNHFVWLAGHAKEVLNYLTFIVIAYGWWPTVFNKVTNFFGPHILAPLLSCFSTDELFQSSHLSSTELLKRLGGIPNKPATLTLEDLRSAIEAKYGSAGEEDKIQEAAHHGFLVNCGFFAAKKTVGFCESVGNICGTFTKYMGGNSS